MYRSPSAHTIRGSDSAQSSPGASPPLLAPERPQPAVAPGDPPEPPPHLRTIHANRSTPRGHLGRNPSPRDPFPAQLQRLPTQEITGDRLDKDPHGGRPVSYTHLRAHETDSYLVCRLLLEKKKEKKKINKKQI